MSPAYWILAAVSIAGVVLNIRKDRRGFALWMVTNISWAIIDFKHELYAQSAVFAVYFALAIRGWILWGKVKT